MGIVKDIEKKAKGLNARIFFPESEDERILKAAEIALKEKYAKPVLVGSEQRIKERAKELKVSLAGFEIIEPENSENLEEYSLAFSQKKNVSLDEARKAVLDPLAFSAVALAEGDAEAMIGGAVYTSAQLMSMSYKIIGLAPGTRTYSSFFVMEIPGYKGGENGALVFADCAVNPNPDAERLADIAVSTGESVKKLLGWHPRIAMLSFSTKGSASDKIPEVQKVIEAAKLAKKRAKGMDIEGEIQADTALVLETARRKMKETGKVAGNANILIFPCLDTGNISYKLVQILCKGIAAGPILQGFAKPISDLSRGASVEDVAGVIAIVSTMAKK